MRISLSLGKTELAGVMPREGEIRWHFHGSESSSSVFRYQSMTDLSSDQFLCPPFGLFLPSEATRAPAKFFVFLGSRLGRCFGYFPHTTIGRGPLCWGPRTPSRDLEENTSSQSSLGNSTKSFQPRGLASQKIFHGTKRGILWRGGHKRRADVVAELKSQVVRLLSVFVLP